MLAFTQDTPRGPCGRQALSLALDPAGTASETSLEKVLSQQDMPLQPQETRSLSEPLEVCSPGVAFSLLLGDPRGLAYRLCLSQMGPQG